MDSSLEFLEKLGTFDKQLSSVLRALRSDIIFLREELAVKHTDIKTLKSDIEIRNNTIADLQARLAERQAVQETKEEVTPAPAPALAPAPAPAPSNPLQPIEETNEEVVPQIEMAEISSPKVAESVEETKKEVVTTAATASEEPKAIASVTPVTSKCKFFCF